MPEDNSYQPRVYRATLAKTPENGQAQGILEERVTVLFRPEDRTEPGSFCYAEDIEGLSFLGVISQRGDHSRRQLPVFDFLKLVGVVDRLVTTPDQLDTTLLENAFSHIASSADVVRYLGEKYPNQEVGLHSPITCYTVEYR